MASAKNVNKFRRAQLLWLQDFNQTYCFKCVFVKIADKIESNLKKHDLKDAVVKFKDICSMLVT